jgi:hypothetical protein
LGGAVEMHKSDLAAFEQDVPYSVVCVKLDEASLLFSSMVGEPLYVSLPRFRFAG